LSATTLIGVFSHKQASRKIRGYLRSLSMRCLDALLF